MANDPILHLIGLARKAGRLEVGEEPVSAACTAQHAKAVLLAGDAAENTARRAGQFSEKANAPLVALPFTKKELGWALGRSSCAMVALTDNGLAASFLEKLAAEDPDQYGEAAQRLSAAAAKTLQRQKEQAAREKAIRKANSKPWAAPAKKTAGKAKGGKGKKQ